MTDGLMSSRTEEWPTPKDFFLKLNEEFHFTLDPCATVKNAKCDRFFTKADNGLIQDWGSDRVFMNPPYGSVIGDWMAKAYHSSLAGATVVCLVPARTDTAWWHDYAMKQVTTRSEKHTEQISRLGECDFRSGYLC
jgi:phage N-6-adenine-methyltransferase